MSAADVIGQVTGREPSERAIIKVAQSTPSVVHPGSIYTKPADAEHPNSGMGTSVADIPTLLAHYASTPLSPTRTTPQPPESPPAWPPSSSIWAAGTP